MNYGFSGNYSRDFGEGFWSAALADLNINGPIPDEVSISPETMAEVREFCEGFLDLVADAGFGEVLRARDAGAAGTYLYLSANDHGTGFWDWGLGDDGDALHAAAKSRGSMEMYIGDDGLVYSYHDRISRPEGEETS